MLGKILFITSPYGGLPQGLRNSLKRMQTSFIEVPIWRMTEAYNEYQPSVVIFFHHFLKEWTPEITDEIATMTCHKFYWDWECPWEIDYITQYHGLFSRILVQDKSSANFINTVTGNKAIFVPHAADPTTNPSLETVLFQYRSDLCFIGAAYPSRVKFMREVLPYLKDYKIVIGGTGWEFLPYTEGQLITQDAIVGQDYYLYTNGAKIVLNLHRGSDELTMANKEKIGASSPNNRFFEVNMMGKFQIVDNSRNPELFDYYPNQVTFEDPLEFRKLFKAWISQDDDRRTFEKKIRQESLEKHTYENRWSEIIANLI